MLSEALKTILHEKNMSLQTLANLSDLPLETLRNVYYGKVADPKLKTAINISRALGVSIHYLLGENVHPEKEEELLENYRKCGSHGKSIILRVAKFEANTAKSERENKDRHEIPCMINVGKLQDGFVYDNYTVEYIYTTNREAYTAIKITSNFYSPAHCKNDIILLADRNPDDGESGLFVKNGLGYIRKLIEKDNKYILKSINGHGSDIELKRMDEIDCVGTCVGVIME